MNWWEWTLVAVVWVLLICAILRFNYCLWNPVPATSEPFEPWRIWEEIVRRQAEEYFARQRRLSRCTGCQRHHVRADCPVHGIGA